MIIPTFPFLLPPFERYIPLPHSISIPIYFTFGPELFPIPLLPSKLFVHYFASVTRPFPYPHIDLFIFMDYSYEPFPLHPHFVPIIPLSFRYLLRVRIKSPEETLPTVSVQPRRLVSEVPRRCPSSTSSKTRSLAYSDPSPRSRPSRPPPSALRPQTFDLSPAISDLRPQTFNFRLATFDLRPQYSFPPRDLRPVSDDTNYDYSDNAQFQNSHFISLLCYPLTSSAQDKIHRYYRLLLWPVREDVTRIATRWHFGGPFLREIRSLSIFTASREMCTAPPPFHFSRWFGVEYS